MIWLALALMALAFVLATSLVRAGSRADAAMRSAWERQTPRVRLTRADLERPASVAEYRTWSRGDGGEA